MELLYLNPFWRRERVMISDLAPDECQQRLKTAKTSIWTIDRPWFSGRYTFYNPGIGVVQGYRSMLELRVHVKVKPNGDHGSRLTLRYSSGVGSAFIQTVLTLVSVGAFIAALTSLLVTRAWHSIDAAGLLIIGFPVLLVFALSSDEPHDEDVLWRFVADQVGGRTG